LLNFFLNSIVLNIFLIKIFFSEKMEKRFAAFFLVLLVFFLGCTQPQQSNGGTPISNGAGPDGSLNGDDAVTPAGGETKEFDVRAFQWGFNPSKIEVSEGDTVVLRISSEDVDHGFNLPQFGVNKKIVPGETVTVEFVADKKGTYRFFCNVFCGEGHEQMEGQLIVN